MKNIHYTRLLGLFMALFMGFTATAQTPFFNENFNTGIPSTWSSVDSVGNSVRFTACDTTCLKAYQDRYSAGFYNTVRSIDGTFLPFSTLKSGVAALTAIRRPSIKATLTSPAINCTGKNKVYVRFATGVWGGVPPDSLETSNNATSTCLMRVSNDGRVWKDYKIFTFSRRDFQAAFFDISDVAANKSTVYVQFRRLGLENNQIWFVDDVSLMETAPLRNITLTVDMTGQTVSPRGVYVANDLNGWKPNSTRMTAIGNGLYSATIAVQQTQKLRYKFMNGDNWGDNESVPIGCGELNAGGYYDRVAVAGPSNSMLDPVCFGACMQCGPRQPQSPFMYCPQGPNVLYCENFEGLQSGKLIPQSPQWGTIALFTGTPLSQANDIPMVTSFWSGFTNFDGSKALRVKSDPNSGTDQPVLDLNDPMSGTYQLDFKLYVPDGHASSFISYTSDIFAAFSMSFSDSLRLYSGENRATGQLTPIGRASAYRKSAWNDVSMTVNLATKQVTLKVNNATVFNAVNPLQIGFAFLQMQAFGLEDAPTTYSVSEMFIDDIIYRRIVTPEVPIIGSQPRTFNASVSPNPANEKLLISPDPQTTDDWQIRLINQLGQVVETQRGSASTPVELSTINYQSGIYIVDFQSETIKWTKKVMIKH